MFNKKQSWTISFTAILKILRLCGKVIPTNTDTFRLISDIEIPTWIPILPSDINCIKLNIEEIDAEWIYPKNIKNIKKHNKYMLYIHGGAFCMCKTGTYRALLFMIASKINLVIFSINYRRSPEFKYPIPLNDCVKGYLYLLNFVKNPEKIILAGDSAGGNLVINLLATLINNNLSVPSKCILISPWTDLTDYGKNPSWNKNNKYDFITPELAKYFSEEYIDLSKNNLFDVSPLYLSNEILSKFPSILVEYGECEVLHDQIEQFCYKIEKLGVNINYNCRQDMTHVFPLFHFTGISQSNDFFNSIKQFIE
jgi:monoterpene epsilon-lactone hydrolase